MICLIFHAIFSRSCNFYILFLSSLLFFFNRYLRKIKPLPQTTHIISLTCADGTSGTVSTCSKLRILQSLANVRLCSNSIVQYLHSLPAISWFVVKRDGVTSRLVSHTLISRPWIIAFWYSPLVSRSDCALDPLSSSGVCFTLEFVFTGMYILLSM